MKKLTFFLAALILLQSCRTYRPVSNTDFKVGKTYKLVLENGQELEGKCHKVETETVSIKVNENLVDFPKSKVAQSQQKKLSWLKVAGGLAVAALGFILILDGDKEEATQVPE